MEDISIQELEELYNVAGDTYSKFYMAKRGE